MLEYDKRIFHFALCWPLLLSGQLVCLALHGKNLREQKAVGVCLELPQRASVFLCLDCKISSTVYTDVKMGFSSFLCFPYICKLPCDLTLLACDLSSCCQLARFDIADTEFGWLFQLRWRSGPKKRSSNGSKLTAICLRSKPKNSSQLRSMGKLCNVWTSKTWWMLLSNSHLVQQRKFLSMYTMLQVSSCFCLPSMEPIVRRCPWARVRMIVCMQS